MWVPNSGCEGKLNAKRSVKVKTMEEKPKGVVILSVEKNAMVSHEYILREGSCVVVILPLNHAARYVMDDNFRQKVVESP